MRQARVVLWSLVLLLVWMIPASWAQRPVPEQRRHIIQQNGTDLADQFRLNFIGGSCVNNATTRATDCTVGGGSDAPASATYITQTPDATLTAEQALSALATGMLRVTTGTGVVGSVTLADGVVPRFSGNTLVTSNMTSDGTSVGIGNPTPESLLHVIGTGQFTTSVGVENTAANAFARFSLENNVGALAQFALSGSGNTFNTASYGQSQVTYQADGAGGIAFLASNATAANNVIKFLRGPIATPSESMRIDGSGNIGIGVAVVNEKLEVSGVSPAARLTNTDTAGIQRFRFYENATNVGDFQVVGSTHAASDERNWMEFVNRSATGGISLWTNTTQRISLNASGNLGTNGATSFGTAAAGVLAQAIGTPGTDYPANQAELSVIDWNGPATATYRMAGEEGAPSVHTFGSTVVLGGDLKTALPTGSTAQAWKLGAAAVVTPTLPNRTIAISVAGTTYYLAAKTTND